MINDVEHIFGYLLVICMSSLEIYTNPLLDMICKYFFPFP